MKKKISPESSRKDWEILRHLFKVTGFRLFHFVIPVILSGAAALFEGLTIAFLMPLVKGVLEKDFTFVYQIRFFKVIVEALPLQIVDAPQKTIFIVLIVGIFACAVLKNIFQYFSIILVDKKISEFLHTIRSFLFARFLSFQKTFFDQANVGELIEGLIHVTAEIAALLKLSYRHFCSLLMLFPYFMFMLWISWPLTLLSLGVSPILQGGVSWTVNKIRESSRILSHRQNDLASSVSNVLMNIGLVKILRTEKKEEEKFHNLSRKVRDARVRVEKKQALVPVVHEMAMLTALIIILTAMAFMVRYGIEEDISQLLIFFILLKRVLGYLGAVTHLRSNLSRLSGPLSVMNSIVSDQGKPFESEGCQKRVEFQREIAFESVSHSYRHDIPALKEATFRLEKGRCTAIVGASGSGKTTVVSLILRLYDPQKGRILLDGQDIREFDLDALRNSFALVSQETFLFNDTIRKNLLYGLQKEVSEERIRKALEKARFDVFVDSLPEGMETYIGDRGVQLSGGEKQRLSIARAILREAPILIFDEATSALDSLTERLVQEAIEEISEGKTTIMIAHRLSTIREADKVIVLENGCVVEAGEFESLLAQKGKFYAYWKEQNSKSVS